VRTLVPCYQAAHLLPVLMVFMMVFPGDPVSHLVLDQRVIGEAQVGLARLSELEGTLVELGDRLVHVQDGVLLVHLTDHLEEHSRATWRSGDQHSTGSSDLGRTLHKYHNVETNVPSHPLW